MNQAHFWQFAPIFPKDSFGSKDTTWILVTAHASEYFLEHNTQIQDCQTLWLATSFLYIKRFVYKTALSFQSSGLTVENKDL